MNNFVEQCFECGHDQGLEHHHVIPVSRGGTKTIPLCRRCHNLVHGRNGKRLDSATNLIKTGMQKAKKNGRHVGRFKGSTKNVTETKNYDQILKNILSGLSIRKTAKNCDVSKNTVIKVKRYLQSKEYQKPEQIKLL